MRDLTVAELAEDAERVRHLLRDYGQAVEPEDVEDMQTALRALIAEPETPPEPTDPAVRVRDADEESWARVEGDWVSPGADRPFTWAQLVDLGPLMIITPDSPAPDDRPLKVGDRVKVADDAISASTVTEGDRSAGAGIAGTIDKARDDGVFEVIGAGRRAVVDGCFLTRLFDEEAAR